MKGVRRSVLLPNLVGAATGLNGVAAFVHGEPDHGYILLMLAITWLYLAEMRRLSLDHEHRCSRKAG